MPFRVLYVGNFNPYETGGTRRAYEIVRRAGRFGIKPCAIHLPAIRHDALTNVGALRALKERVIGVKAKDLLSDKSFDLIAATSESPACVLVASSLARALKTPWTAIMQLPVRLTCTPASTVPIIVDPLWLPEILMSLRRLSETTALVVSVSVIIESDIRTSRYLLINPGVGIDVNKYSANHVFEKVFDAVFMARLTPEKGVYDIVKIWKYVAEENPKARLVVIGRFKNRRIENKFSKLVGEFRMDKNITYTGYLNGDKKIRVLKSSKIFIYPSVLDAFPTVVLEALMGGLPAVAYDIPAISFNYPTKSVIRVPIKDHKAFAENIITLLEDEPRINKLGDLGVAFASKFTWDEVVKAEVKLYEELIEAKR